jgi:diguanylate cyclase (GGDEF)-like protein
MPKLKSLIKGSNAPIALILAAAMGAVVFTAGAGAFLYNNTKALVASAQWVEHTHEVLSALQRALLLVERVDYRSQLYRLSKDGAQFSAARSNASQLEIQSVRLGELVADSPYQAANARNLETCSADLAQAVNKLTPASPQPESAIEQCRQIINLMTAHEQGLLASRTTGTQHNTLVSITTEFGFVGLSLVTLIVLFGFLLRDAFLRRRISKESAATNIHLAQTVNALRDRARESELLTSARDELQLCVDPQQLYQSAAGSFSRLLAGTNGSLCMIDNSRQMVEVCATWAAGGVLSAVQDFSPPEACCGLRSGQPRWRRPGVSEIQCAHFNGEPPERYLCKPIVAHGNAVGVLYVQCPTEQEVQLVNERMDGLRQLVQLTGMAIAALHLRTKLENQSIRDSLTDLFNRHFMEISLERELSRAGRHHQMLGVLMLDVDHFKNFNDTHGHAAGDAVLQGVAAALRSSVRAEDIVCRYGGEEFTMILPDVTETIAIERAEAIRRIVADLRVPAGSAVFGNLSISIGVALYPQDGDSSDLLLRRADQALYRAKHDGRNQVALFHANARVS